MNDDVAPILREIAERLRETGQARDDAQREFREELLAELRRLNRTLERMLDRQTVGDL